MDEETRTTEQPAAQENQKPDAPAKEPPAKDAKPERNERSDTPPLGSEADEGGNSPAGAPRDEVASLRAQLARANMMSTAAIEAAKLGVEAGQIPYVLRLAELPESGKAEDIAAAVQKVLDDVPAFKPDAGGTRSGIRIGAKDAAQNDQNEALARAFGNQPRNK